MLKLEDYLIIDTLSMLCKYFTRRKEAAYYKWFKKAFAGSHLFVGILVIIVTAKGHQFYMTLTRDLNRDPRDTSAMIRDLSKGVTKNNNNKECCVYRNSVDWCRICR